MHMNKIFGCLALLGMLAGCSGTGDGFDGSVDWFEQYDASLAGAPAQMYGTLSDGYGAAEQDAQTHEMAVLLPLTGDFADVGRAIRASVQMAVLQNAPDNLNVSFYDTNTDLNKVMSDVLAKKSEVIVGPVFAGDAKQVQKLRPNNIPVLSFTSDATAVGDGVMTMALMPTNSVESIVREMQADGVKRFIVMAPDTVSGQLMAGTAKNAAAIYNVPLAGVFLYTEKDSESIKNAVAMASMNNSRTMAHTRARQVLSDILINERLTALEKSGLNYQLEKLSRTDTVGNVPYDAVLFLGTGDDTKSLASFFRYYNVGARDARFYGTTVWDGSDVAYDYTMTGAKFATLPESDEKFKAMYEKIAGEMPNRLASFGYDATTLAIGMMYSDKSDAAYLLDPSGYKGTDGLFRLKPTGDNERALQIVQIDGAGHLKLVRDAAEDFVSPLYNIEQRHIQPAYEMSLQTPGVDPDDFINIPERLESKYRSKTIGANVAAGESVEKSQLVAIMPSDDAGDVITSDEFKPVKLESVSRSYIDEYEVYEE